MACLFYRLEKLFHQAARIRQTSYHPFRSQKALQISPITRLFFVLAAGLLLGGFFVKTLESRIRPVLTAAAETTTVNTLSIVVEHAVLSAMEENHLSYGDFITITRDTSDKIQSISGNMAAMNQMRSLMTEKILNHLSEIDVSSIQIPLGTVFNSEFLWARGPFIKVRSMTVGTVTAEFNSEFQSAGMNQSLHRVYLNVTIPLTIILPTGKQNVTLNRQICIAETVIVGTVPEVFFQIDSSLK